MLFNVCFPYFESMFRVYISLPTKLFLQSSLCVVSRNKAYGLRVHRTILKVVESLEVKPDLEIVGGKRDEIGKST